ncbi:hypothetical protein P9027_26375 [Bacillus thuringiensis]|uniref:hypothetical protein n=1 Tax=Bacillus thuringiensis TaxID=1428 RepID=UPI002DBB4677|nr:hypothetical protein [Bacillus thuringiensis]MEC3225479.1 hypothetical protein [Bacillus thuringiensis]MEC3556163.1 hypothetical protein [Bacillus thuringiensis]
MLNTKSLEQYFRFSNSPGIQYVGTYCTDYSREEYKHVNDFLRKFIDCLSHVEPAYNYETILRFLQDKTYQHEILSHVNFQSAFDEQAKDSIIHVLANESEIIETVSTRMKQLINRVRKPMDPDKYVLLDFIQKANTYFVPIDDGNMFDSMTKSELIGFLLGQEWIFGFGEMDEFEWTPFIHIQFSGHIVPYKELFVYLPRKDFLNLKGTDLEKYVSERFFDMANRKSIFEVDFMNMEHRKQIEAYMLEKSV